MARLAALADLAERLAGESGRLKKRAAIAEAIRAVHEASPGSEDAGLFALYLAGTPFAEADSRKLNAGGALLSKALLEVSGATQIELTAAYKRHGDLGAAGFDLLSNLKSVTRKEPTSGDEAARYGAPSSSAGLTVAAVAEAFAGMAVAKTTAIRAGLVEGLLRRASPLEAKYLLKLMIGDMRIGVKQSLVEEAIAAAAEVPVAAVRNAVMLEADLGAAVRRAFAGTLQDARMRLFHPLGFMLASPVESPEEAVERFSVGEGGDGKGKSRSSSGMTNKKAKAKTKATAGPSTPLRSAQDDTSVGGGSAEDGVALDIQTVHIEAFLEDKYDGMRAQVHCGDPQQPGRVAIYSRNREDVTESYPDLEEAFARVGEACVGPLIFDGEILGWDLKEARALPFAVLGQRIGRKRVSNEWRRQVPVIFMAFDLMYADDELLLERPLRERRNRLETVVEKLVEVVRSPLAVDERKKSAQGFMFAEPEEEGVERLLLAPSRLVESAEDIDRAYAEARARANEGVMLKAAESVYQPGRRGLAWMKMKRELATLDVVVTGAEFGHGKRAGILSDYTFAVRGADGELLNVGKAYSGLTDVEIAEMSAWMMEHTLEDRGFFRTVEPLRVLEVAFNNIMRSPRHASGFALRFPRIVRIRDDKPVNEIDTVERVEEVYQSQVDKPVESET
ncbi:ATP-dependent DNA ligase [Edaphobacter bradus]|uniref:ATP-dependent DNA ligase n=1 Tax=Edaphobacter bradus TaxID=2259016 RepID=UPI0021E0A3E2|nr:ATP-dependent DNA ligase [Edaphobacter bradus]